MPAGRIEAARHLLHPQQVRDSLALAKQPSLRNASLAGLQAALALAIALPLVHLSPWSPLIGYASLGALVALFGRFAPQRSRNRILALCALSQTLAVFVMSAAGWTGMPLTGQLVLLALGCGVFYFVAIAGQFGPPGPLIFIFAVGAAMQPAISFRKVLERSAATAIVALLAWAICAVSERFRHHPTPERAFPADPPRPASRLIIASGRSALGAAIAIFTAHALGAHHPVWAAMGAMAVLQGTHLQIGMNRALQRMAGTVVGAMLVWVVLEQQPSVWGVIALLVFLQYATELIIGTNYGLGQVLVTPMALLMTHLGAPEATADALVPERIVDTMMGAAIGIVIAVLWSSLDDRRHLARQASTRRAPDR